MKSSRSTNNKQSKQGLSHVPRPEIRDNLDSRQSKEINHKGNKNKQGDKKKSE